MLRHGWHIRFEFFPFPAVLGPVNGVLPLRPELAWNIGNFLKGHILPPRHLSVPIMLPAVFPGLPGAVIRAILFDASAPLPPNFPRRDDFMAVGIATMVNFIFGHHLTPPILPA